MAWLSNWAKRIKINIDHTKAYENLTDFPVLISLKNTAGQTSFDATDVFDTLSPVTSGNVFYDNFTASGINWTHTAGTTVYSSGYMDQTADSTTDETISYYEFGKFFDLRFRMKRTNGGGASPSNYTRIYICVNNSDRSALMLEMLTYSSSVGTYYIRLYKQESTSFTQIFENATWNYGLDVGSWFWVNIRREDDRLFFKVWRENTTEPTNWYYDISGVFDTLTPTYGKIRMITTMRTGSLDDITLRTHSVVNYRKLAVTASDGVAQCPVEVEWWDPYEKKAWLWTKIPTISSGTDTTIYLYYDNTQLDNTAYVGYTDSLPAQAVWDSNFIFVSHMNVAPNKGYLKDSTIYNIDSSAFTVDLDDYFLGTTGPNYSFDSASPDRIDLGYNNVVTTNSGQLTVESVFNAASTTGGYSRGLVAKGESYASAKKSWFFMVNGTTSPYRLQWQLSNTGSEIANYNYNTTYVYDHNIWYYGACKFNPSTEATIWVNDTAALRNTTTVPSSVYVNPTQDAYETAYVGYYGRNGTSDATYAFDGRISETRISKVARSDAWLRATYYTLWDQLLVYDSISPIILYYYHGYVKEEGTNVVRTVRLYRRSTGELMDECSSNMEGETGYYYLTTPHNEEHYVVAFDDDLGASYNAIVVDRLAPTGISE